MIFGLKWIWYAVGLFSRSLPSFFFLSRSFFNIEYLICLVSFFPIFGVYKREKKNRFFIRVCGSISPPSFLCLFPFELYYISLVSVLSSLFLQSFLVSTCSKCWLWLSVFERNLALYLSLFFFPFSIITSSLSLSLAVALLFCWIYYFSLFFCIDSKICFGEDCVNGYTYILICIACKWFRVLVDPSPPLFFFCSRVNDNYGMTTE